MAGRVAAVVVAVVCMVAWVAGGVPGAESSVRVAKDEHGSASVALDGVGCTFSYDARESGGSEPPPPPPSPPPAAEAGGEDALGLVMQRLAAALPCVELKDAMGYVYAVCAGRGEKIVQRGLGENNVVGIFEGVRGNMLVYGAGDRCFDTGLPRTATVSFVCEANVPPAFADAVAAGKRSAAGAPYLVSVAEMHKCEYAFFVVADAVCGDPRFDAVPTSGVNAAVSAAARAAGAAANAPSGVGPDTSTWVVSIARLLDGGFLCSAALALEPGHVPRRPLRAFRLELTPTPSPAVAAAAALSLDRARLDAPGLGWVDFDPHSGLASTPAYADLAPSAIPTLASLALTLPPQA